MKNKQLLPIFLTIFLSMLGFTIIIPITAPLLLSSDVILKGMEQSNRLIILGLLLGSYALAQFFGAPILGAYSDRYGRKKLLIVSLLGSILGYILFALGVIYGNLAILFISRLIDGFTGGNISVANSAISDVSSPDEKAKNFALTGIAFGIGFIIGPFLGGKLADSSIVSWFNYVTPFWFAALLSIINLILILVIFKETLKEKIHNQVHLFTGIRNIKKAFQYPQLRTLFIVAAFAIIGFNFFTQFFQVFLIGKFNFNQSEIGNLFAYIGLWVIISQGVILRPLLKITTPKKILNFCILSLSISLIAILIPSKSIYLFFILPFISIFQGLTMTNSTALISNSADKKSQGEVMGINQSLQSISMIIPPIVSGFISVINISMPIIVSAVLTFIGWVIFYFSMKKKEGELFKESE